MNVQAIIVSDLRKKLATAQAQVTQIQSTLALYGETGEPARRRRRRVPSGPSKPKRSGYAVTAVGPARKAAPLAGVAD